MRNDFSNYKRVKRFCQVFELMDVHNRKINLMNLFLTTRSEKKAEFIRVPNRFGFADVYTESGLKLLGLDLASLATQGVGAGAQPNAYTGYGINRYKFSMSRDYPVPTVCCIMTNLLIRTVIVCSLSPALLVKRNWLSRTKN